MINSILSIMPLLFVGHGSPMNAIEENTFTAGWQKIAKEIPKPKAILCISAHWETKGPAVYDLENPKTIHDFGGFPPSLYKVEYPAKGKPELAEMINKQLPEIQLTNEWGIDHGTWSVLVHMYPNADIPVLQLSLDHYKTPKEHFELAKKLVFLREQGILIMASGNIVHNLSTIKWTDDNNAENSYLWAKEFNDKVKSLIINNKYEELINYKQITDDAYKAVPTPEHYLPLLYILALKKKGENVQFFNDNIVMGSLSMTSILIK